MTRKISVVIICKNEEHIIGKTLDSVRDIALEMLVYDTGSTDATISIAEACGARVVRGPWEGYGASKQAAIRLASSDWILNLDADEVPDGRLASEISRLDLSNEKIAYRFRFRHFMGQRQLKWGEFGFDSHVRLFNRKHVSWNDHMVHEQLQIPGDVRQEKVKGSILHYTMKDTADFVTKTVRYALSNAESYHARGKRSTWIKQYISPSFTFFKYYILRLGFLDGWAGLFSAKMSALYSYVKYARLRELEGTGNDVQ
jgi:glycosyltransferase involved in cell wall biosynthesis